MKKGISRRAVLGGALGAAVARTGLSKVALKPKRILTLVRDASTNTMRAVERIVWVAR